LDPWSRFLAQGQTYLTIHVDRFLAQQERQAKPEGRLVFSPIISDTCEREFA